MSKNVQPTLLKILFLLFTITGYSSLLGQPVINVLNPSAGPTGSSVNINGTGFNSTAASNIVYFGGVKATVTAASATNLTVTVPVGASYQPLSVTNLTGNLTGYSYKPFNATFSGGNLAFGPKQNQSMQALAFAIGDLDGNGQNDLAITNIDLGVVSVLRNISTPGSGSISFAAKVDYNLGAAGTSPKQIKLADITGDGKLDIIVTSTIPSVNGGDPVLQVLRNTNTTQGVISFAAKVDFPIPGGVNAVNTAEINGDGKPDIILTSANQVSLFRNNSTTTTISLAARVDFPTGTGPAYTAVGDLDLDGKVDLVVANSTNSSISTLRNISSGTTINFEPREDYLVGTGPQAPIVADLDGDGLLEVAVGCGNGKISIFRNESTTNNINLAAAPDVTAAASYPHMTADDLDGDGKPEIIGLTGGNTAIIHGNTSSLGIFTFDTPITTPAGNGANYIGSADLDNDGKPDLVVSNYLNEPIGVLRQITPAPVISSFTPTAGPVGTAVTITGNYFNTTPAQNSVFFGATRATVSTASRTSLQLTVPQGASFKNINVANLVNKTAAASSRPFSVTLAGTTNYSAKTDHTSGTNTQAVASADLNGDGKADIVTANLTSATVSVFKNVTLGILIEFETRLDYNAGLAPASIELADIDNDGRLDIVVTNNGSNTVSVLKNTSSFASISFAAKVDFPTASLPNGLAVADIDKDGRLDIIVANNGSNSISVLRNTSTSSISFAAKVDFTTGLGPKKLATAEIDTDTWTDIAVTNSGSNTISVFKNTSSLGVISFNPKSDFATGTGPFGIVIGDLDGNTRPEIAVSNNTANTVSVFRNISTSSISFNTKLDFPTGTTPWNLAIGDIDGNNRNDLVTVNGADNSLSILRNTTVTTPITFAAKVDYTTGTEPVGIIIGDLDNDTRPDLVSANNAAGSMSVFRQLPPAPTITQVSPTSAGMGAEITITGTNFYDVSSITFGNVPAASFLVNSPTSITAFVANGASGSVNVTTPSGTATIAGFVYTGPRINSFTPASAGPGMNVTISGSNFLGVTEVNIGGTPAASFIINTNTSITATVAAGSTGNITVVSPNGTATSAGVFTFVETPVINNVTPLTAGTGTTVTITGNFLTGATSVKFGGTAASIFSVVNVSTITAQVPGGSSGDVTVTTAGGTAAFPGFTYVPPPTITSFTPTSAGAGNIVQINGTNLLTVTAVTFGGVQATFVPVSDTRIDATVGTGATGSVVVTTIGGTANRAGFSFIPAPIITSFTPTTAATGGFVTINGSQFSGATAVSFGGVPASSFVVVSNSVIHAVVGPGTSGAVSVTTPGGTHTLNGFVYNPLPVITAFSPEVGGCITSTNITITGLNFTGVTSVKAGTAELPYIVNSTTNISATVPPGTTGRLSVTTGLGTATTTKYFGYGSAVVPYAYIPNSTDGTISVINTLTNAVTTPMSPGTSAESVVLSPDGTRLYVGVPATGRVRVYNTETFALITTINISNPTGLALSPDGTRLYVSNTTGGSVSIINTTTYAVSGTYNMSSPVHMITSADGGFLYVANKNSNTVVRVNTTTNAQNSVSVGTSPVYLSLAPDGSKLFVANNGAGTVSVINMFNFTLLTTIGAGTNPTCLALNNDGSRLYVSNYGSANITVINTSTNTGTSVTVPANPYGVSISPDGATLYVAGFGTNVVTTISTATNTVAGSITVGAGPKAIGNFIAKVFTPCLPYITSFTPTQGCTGSLITITGLYFSNITSVKFGGSEATSFTVVNPTTIEATVGEGVSGPVSVTSIWGTGTSSNNFTSDCPTITSINPVNQTCGINSVDISGTGFVNVSEVKIGTAAVVSFTVNSPNSITAQVLATTLPGKISVTTSTGTAYSLQQFTIGTGVSSLAYVTGSSNNITVINTETNTVITTIPVGAATGAITSSRDGNYVYAGAGGSVKVIETATNTLIKTFPTLNSAADLELSPDGKKLYVADNNSIYVFDLINNSLLASLNSAGQVLEMNNDGTKIYMMDGSGIVRVYNTGTNTIIKTINPGVSAGYMKLNPSGTLLYLLTNAGTIKVINTFSQTVVNTIPVAAGSQAICFSPDGSTAYISNNPGAAIQVLNTATGIITGSFPVGTQPRGLQVSADGTKLFVKHGNTNTVSVVDLAGNTIVATIPVASSPSALGDFIVQRVQVCAPVITGFSPSSAGCNAAVIITGDNFLRADSVKLGSLPADSFIVNSNTQITAYFPPGSSGLISVRTNGGVAQAVGNFTSTCPAISFFSPKIGCEGTAVEITGINFTGVTGVKIGGKEVSSFTVNSGTSISAIAGIGFNGPVTVTTAEGEAVSDTMFVFGTATAPFAYVANSGSNSVSVINGSTNSVSATVSVGSSPDVVVVSPDGSKAYVNNGGTISIIHTATNTVVGSISGGALDMAFTNDGTRLYMLSSGSLRYYNTVTNTLSPVFSVANAAGMAISPGADKVYIATTNNRLKIFDVFSQVFTERGFIGSSPKGMAVTPDGRRLFIVNTASNSVTVLDPLSHNLINTISPGTNPKGIAISPDGTRIYVSNAGSANVRVIDAVNGTNLNTIAVGTTPAGLSVSPDGTKLYVANEGSNNVTIINTVTNAVITTVTVGNVPKSFGKFTALVPTPCAPIIVSFDPALACSSGTTVTIKGANFRGATAVTFNGVNAASFAVVSDTVITAVTGTANNSGIIKVFTPWGVDSSATPITMSNVPAFLPNPNPFQLCAGAPRQFQPNIAGSFTYTASNGQSGSNIIISAPGTYTVTATDQYGCSNSSTFNVTNYTNCDGYLEIESEPMINYFDTLTVRIRIKGGVNIFSTFAYLNFNTTHLKYVDHTPGNYLGSNVFVQDPVVVGGQIDFGMSHITGDPGTYGDGIIWQFRFVLADQIPNIVGFNAVRPEFFTTNLTLTNLSIYNALGVQPPSFPALSMLTKPVALRYYVPVWPGDLNFDKKVTVADILPIGYFYVATGPVRPNASIFWTPQPSALWGFDKTNKTRNAYRTFADGTPDGVINLADQTSIGFNLGNFHLRDTGTSLYQDPTLPFPENIPSLNVNMPDEELTGAQLPKNEVVTMSLGSPSLPLNNVYGIAFDVFFNPAAVNTSAITTNYTGSIFGTLGTHFTRIEDRTALAQGRISIGITRYNTTAINATGGNVMTITLPILASAPQGLFKVTGIPVGCNDPVGNDLQVGPGADSLLINNGQPCSSNTWQGTVSNAWENPANWSCGSVPTATTVVFINNGSPYHPVISSMATCKTLFLNNTMTLTVNTGFKLDLTGP